MPPFRLPLAVAALFLAVGYADGQSPLRGENARAKKVAWGDVTADAFVAAHRTGKPILVYVTAEKCAFCQKMERETWSDPKVGELVAKGYVPLKLHADTHPEEVATLRIKAFPTTVLVTPQGKPYAGRVGFVEPEKLIELLQPEVASTTVRQPAL